jgi:pimeloyl-ACP methyl ester carboxylesterase
VIADEHGSGAAVVLLHGQPGDAHDWDPVVDRLAGRVRALVADRPGYGRTGGRAGGFAANAAATVNLLDERGIEQAVVVGHSWAGGIALTLAQRYPERVSGMVLVGSVGGDGSTGELDRLLGVPVLGPLLTISGLTLLRPAPVRHLLAPVHAPGDRSAVDVLPARWVRSWRSFVTEERALLDELPGIARRVPGTDVAAVVVIGEADRVVPPRSQDDLAARLPRATAVRLAGRGHLLPREAPDALARSILAIAGDGAAGAGVP